MSTRGDVRRGWGVGEGEVWREHARGCQMGLGLWGQGSGDAVQGLLAPQLSPLELGAGFVVVGRSGLLPLTSERPHLLSERGRIRVRHGGSFAGHVDLSI